MSEVETILTQLNKELEQEESEKVKKAIQLFIKVDDVMKRVCLHGSGFSGELNAKNLRVHFQNMDLMDMLDSAIEDLEYDLESNPT